MAHHACTPERTTHFFRVEATAGSRFSYQLQFRHANRSQLLPGRIPSEGRYAMTWVKGTVRQRVDWCEGLFSLIIDATIDTFEPGQFVNVTLDTEGDRLKRSYSLASIPGERLELLLVRVEDGALTPRLYALKEGDPIYVDDKPQGFFTLSEVPSARDLWLVASGTGIAPFISMLRADTIRRRFQNIVLVHGSRTASALAFRPLIRSWIDRGDSLRYLAAVTRESPPNHDRPTMLHGRITETLANGQLEQAANLELCIEHSHVMLCGNPAMVNDMTSALKERGLNKHRRRRPGHITTERYW